MRGLIRASMHTSLLLSVQAEALLEEAAALDSQDGQDPRLDLQNNGPLRFMDTSSIEPSDNAVRERTADKYIVYH